MNILNHYKLYFVVSLIFLIPGLLSLLFFGLKPSIDFTGGAELEVRLEKLPESEQDLVDISNDIFIIQSIQATGEHQWILKGSSISFEEKQSLIETLESKYGLVTELQFSQVGPSVSKELLAKTITAVAIVSIIILVYVWQAFDEIKYGVCAILAMFHDSLILLGSFSVLGHFYNVEVDVLFVTALLTTLSFSVHDTIVVFDRIRELQKKNRSLPLIEVLNTAVIETLSRSINNSMTIIFMLLSLSLLGGESIRWFGVALLIGAITGTYSSTFTAVPLLLLWDSLAGKKLKGKR